MTDDPRIVYGAVCVWWGPISETAKTPSGLPCCPHCGGVLFEVESDEVWWVQVRTFAAANQETRPDYEAFVLWLRDNHQPDYPTAWEIWKATQAGGGE